MRRVRFPALVAAFSAVVGFTASPADAQPPTGFASIKGQVVFPAAKPIPKRDKLNITQDKMHCMSKGDILDESVIVNDKNRGIKNVLVWLRPDNTDAKKNAFPKNMIHPSDAERKPADVVIDQPCCMFIARITTARPGDTIVVKNPAPVAHNFFWTSDNSGSHNPTIAAKNEWRMPNLLASESAPIQYKCSIHPWMDGYVRVFDHPYYAVTDENGNFEIKNAPVGKWRAVIWHEKVGYLNGKEGRFGTPIEVVAAGTEMKPTEFDVVPPPAK